jgi:signal transduction histidine kinase
MSAIFNSIYTLEFCDLKLEKEFFIHRNIRKNNIIFTGVTLGLSILCNLCLEIKEFKIDLYYFMRYMGFVVTFLHLLFLIISIKVRNTTFHRIIGVLNFIVLELVNYSFRIYLNVVLGFDVIYMNLIYTLHSMFRLAFFFTNTLDFKDGFIGLFVVCITPYVFYFHVIDMNIHFRFGINSLMSLLNGVVSYVFVYAGKKSFYFSKQNEKNIKWFRSIIENMNSGFVSITNRNINYINKTFSKILGVETDEDFASIYDSNFSKVVLDIVFKKLDSNLDDNICSFANVTGYLKKNSDNENFVYISNNNIGNNIFEIYGRFYTNELSEENFEFIFNDITRVKKDEEINAEIKYKSLLLSKVAHEFKNPILCISELVDQISEKLDYITDVDVSYNLKNIKSMSDYLIILIKDMDFFSLKNNSSNKILVAFKEIIKISDVLIFCKNITNILIRKFHKENVKLIIDNKSNLTYIETDEIKLKQVLVNLLSNSVKFTSNGNIILSVEEVSESIVFSVSDTGKGISQHKLVNLFKPFVESNIEHNTLGSGLGLSIVKELITIMGSNINCETVENHGTKFWFSLKKTDIVDNVNYHNQSSPKSEKTIKTDLKKVTMDKLKVLLENDNKVQEEMNYTFNDKNVKYVLVIDDEIITRKSTIRVISNFCNENGINIKIIEGSDGIECLYLYYQAYKKGANISLILTDQCMNYMNGSVSAKILNEVNTNRDLPHIPLYIVTAYESFTQNGDGLDGTYTKPLTRNTMKEIFENLKLL